MRSPEPKFLLKEPNSNSPTLISIRISQEENAIKLKDHVFFS